MLLTARNLSKHYGPRLLFSNITLGLEEGERVGLIGANGSGKSTLLRVFAGIEPPDEGELIARRGLRVAYVPQEDVFHPAQTCHEIITDAVDEHVDEHDREVRAYQLLDRANFVDPSAEAGSLSGGWRKRLAIVRQMAREPDLMLMDEPTNHLDLEGIEWLEDLIDAGKFATLIVSHDRRFLEETATRIIELSRAYPDGFLSHDGAYSAFVEKREEFMAAQQGRQQALASGVRREIEWLRRGAKARTTKAKGRIDRAHEMMADLADIKTRNTAQGSAKIDFNASQRQTKKLVRLENVAKAMGGRELFHDVTVTLSPKTKLGLLGPNGSGKSTLIKLIRGTLQPDSGTIVRADALKIVVFDQHREQLDPDQPLRRALSPNGDSLVVRGQPMHVTGWARRFLFRGEQLDLPVSELSGGEQARVLIARLMLQEADVLVLDEPTNDLDIPTLDVLESSLEEFAGAVLLVTHDRYLLDRLSTELLALDGEGGASMFASLDQWERSRSSDKPAKPTALPSKSPPAPTPPPAKPIAGKKLNWKDRRELETIEATIQAAEGRLAALQAESTDPTVVADFKKSRDAFAALGAAQAEVDRLYARWAELEKQSL
ncbi:MAG TPA: ABC-F family ATP-binding cassette domain-containing protein [Tepidisphaeraceae bacterium]|jgi:ATP-binding cassette subfamily F protein uup